MNVLSSNLQSNIASDAPNAATSMETSASRIPMMRQFLRVAIRRRYVIVGATAACILLGLIITLLMTPKYTAVTTIEISRESDKITSFQGVERDASVADQEFYQTQYGLLRSRTLSERVATQLNLVNDPSFFARFGAAKDNPAFQITNGHYPASGRAERQRVAGQTLLDNLSVDPARLSRLVNINFTSPDAKFSARVANAWAENFIQTNLERKIQATSYGREVLEQQLAQLKERLDESQRQLVTYASTQKIINLPAQGDGQSERSLVADNLETLNNALAQATTDRIQAEARYREVGHDGASSLALGNLAINNLRQSRAELAAQYQRMMTQFQPDYPSAKAIKSQIDDLDKSINREENRASESMLADLKQAQERERTLLDKVNDLKAQYIDLRRRSIQYNIYQQEVDTNRALYDGVLQRFKEIGVAGGVGVNNISIADPADIPQEPSSPKLLINIIISFVLGFGIGSGLAFVLEQMDESIDDPGEVERRLGLPLLGTVPKVDKGSPRDALLDRKSELVDAYLAVHTNLRFTTEHGVPRSLSITSTRPSEGKSTTALSLATMLARAQRKVILIDGDMRSPSVHHLGHVANASGLSNFLAGEDAIEPLVFEIADLGFTAMAAGPLPPNAAELLTGNRLSLLIARLLETYDHVVIDSPPVMGLADAPLIGGRVEGVIYAVESHGIRSSLVKTALGRLGSANAHVVGGVLTKFEAKKAHYGYGYEYGYGYGRAEQEAAKASSL